MLELHSGELDVNKIVNNWYNNMKYKNHGAFITFVGIVRDEDGISGLSFDIYEPILKAWFQKWQEKASEDKATLYMAHSIGNVSIHNSSYIAAISSPKRKVALKLIDDFVEDFKASAPIWKYDLKKETRIYAQERSHSLNGSGILS